MTASPEQVRQRIHDCQGLVRSIAWKLHQRLPSGTELDDLIGYGQLGLAEAARDFDQSRGNQFTTYAWYRIRGAILDGLSRMAWFNRADYFSGRYEAAANAVLTDSATNIADSQHAAWFSRTAGSLGAACILTAFSGAQGEIQEPSVEDGRSSLETTELQSTIRTAVSALPDAERHIVEAVYFKGLTITEAASQLDISKPWASRLHSRALELLAVKLADN
ncbi:MAG: Sigma-F factor [Planctomycetota bacterium]|jgi:RNA polymerase sigma factor for flagellar operon FliA